ncbi:spore germination protein GerPC [Sutcliffiella rhizosphaerae]|uniref:Spore germination protein GerPC n=1 Tax=Sutcliffiella rhizosphaerae TaxID=2880967 RepID=A0ABN8ADW7_9BACI|nr:spore germination protein GerPC [Sutcliffiella rhizosphaerae]CAG9623461.1 putative spore germination protein GerPC [Sutcliffiella rhizosphaerae]
MYNNHSYFYNSQQQINQLQSIVENQSKQISTLEELLKIMQQEIIQLKEKPSMNIERIEYKFDQLKVETLEGTLNIGLTPGGTGDIEDFVVTKNNLEVPVPNPSNQYLANGIQEEIRSYLDQQGASKIKNIAEKQGKDIDEHYYDFMIQDVAKQLPSRVSHTLNGITAEAVQKGYNDTKIKEVTVRKLQNDIEKAFSTFIQSLPSSKK